ncbi:MAG TPA: nicotinamide-nucleotide amidohydrolase family protein [Parafilimonas sp.]|nr:nicotinamide-nucleotide amidohydrolase family protein [Parafilimonas sp.]
MIFDKSLIDSIGNKLKKNNQSIALAESVTSGLLQAAFSNADGASFFFQGGITAYNIGQKSRHLFVEPLHAIECNCVSEKVSQQMAINVCNLFVSDYGIGITGYAAKLPEKNINELFAYYAIAARGKILDSGKIIAAEEEGLPAQLFYVNQVLKIFNQTI